MSARNLELAHEFAALVGASDLLDYLGVDHTASAEELRRLLKDKRRYMQGMQSNPKYKHQALFLIKHFSALDEVLQAPLEYADDVRRRKESEHLPVLEMTIQGVLKGGRLNAEQVQYLTHQSAELGVSEQTFQEMLARLCEDAGVVAPLPRLSETEREADYYAILGLNHTASRDQIYDAYRRLYREAKSRPEVADSRRKMEQADHAWRVLGDPRTRQAYDLAQEQTAPPAITRTPNGTETVSKASTAPPVMREAAPAGPPTLEIFGEPVRSYSVSSSSVTDIIKLKTRFPMGGFITSTAPEWLSASPSQLAVSDEPQDIYITISPDFDGMDATAALHIVTEHGDRAQVVIEAYRPRVSPLTAFLAIAAVLAVGLAVFIGSLNTPTVETASGLTITVDPRADDIILNGVHVGSGSKVYVSEPPKGPVTLRVTQRNFKTFEQTVEVPEGEQPVIPVRLELSEPMTFTPSATAPMATMDLEVARQAGTPRAKAVENCVARTLKPGDTASGKVVVFIGESGRAKGFAMDGPVGNDPEMLECIKREAAAVYVHPLEGGSYARLGMRFDAVGK